MINHNWCKAMTMDSGRTFEGEGATPREAGAACLAAMKAGRGRAKLINVQAVEQYEGGFRFDLMGSPRWNATADQAGIENLPQAI